MALNDIKVPRENASGTFDEITLAPSDIGAQSLFTQTTIDNTSNPSPYQIVATRARTLGVFTNDNYDMRLPASGHAVGDIVDIFADTLSAGKTITIQRDISGSGVWFTAGTITVQGSKRRFVANGTGSNNWAEDKYFTTDGTVAAAEIHTHAASAITSGTLDIARIPTGTTNATVCIGNDARLSDARTPASHVHSGADITSGTVGAARLGSGTADATTFLRGDGAWATPSGGGSGGSTNLWIPASAWIPKTTAGCGVDSRETTTNDQNFDQLLFDTGSDELADALVVMPSNYNNGTITARFYWTAASGSGGVAWGIQGRAFADDDALDTAAGAAKLVTDTLIAANDMHITSATSAVTLGGTPAANRPIQFTIYRDVSDAADTLGVDARLLGVEVIFN
jgi:hypothetical protein